MRPYLSWWLLCILVGSLATGCTQPVDTTANLNQSADNQSNALYTVKLGDHYQLMFHDQPIAPLPAEPSQITFSSDPDLALLIVDEALYLVALQPARLTRVYEGVSRAEFSDSNRRVLFTTTDGRQLSQDL